MKRILGIFIVVGLVLGACSNKTEQNQQQGGSVNDGETPNNYGAIDHGVDDKQVGFNLTGGEIEEAAGIPAAEKEQILKAFDVYIEAFNEGDIDQYFETLSTSTESFDLAEERAYMEELFATFDLQREVSDVTIVKYTENEAQVFTNLKTSLKQLSTGLQTTENGRQVTVFVKEDGDWKVSSVHYIGEEKK